jgi:transglutaminase-like putative cysteine protease
MPALERSEGLAAYERTKIKSLATGEYHIVVIDSMNYRITHKTQYKYTDTVNLCYNEARLTPRSFARQVCARSRFVVEPEPTSSREREDFFGNSVRYFTIQHPHKELTVTVTSDVQVNVRDMNRGFAEFPAWEVVRQRLQTDRCPEILEIRQYILDSPMLEATLELREYAEPSFAQGLPLLEAVENLMARIHRDFIYEPGFTTLVTPLADVMKHRRGVCQDFAHLGIGCLRALGLAARYISGYIKTVPPPGEARLVGADASHAWFSVYAPDVGWIDFDPTNNQMPTDQHITVAWGRDYSDVTPLKGVVFGSGTHELSVSVDCEVQR